MVFVIRNLVKGLSYSLALLITSLRYFFVLGYINTTNVYENKFQVLDAPVSTVFCVHYIVL